MRLGLLIAGGAVVAIAAVVVLLISDSDEEARRVSLEGVEVSPRAAGVNSGDPDDLLLETPATEFEPGLTQVEVGTCPASTRAAGYGGPHSINGNPRIGRAFTYADDQRSLITSVENSAEGPVSGRFVLICSPV